MAGPRSKRKRADATNAPLPRRPRRDAGEGEDPEMMTTTTTTTPTIVPSEGGPPQPELGDEGESSMEVEDVPHPPLQDQVDTEGGQLSAAETIGPSNLAELLSHRKALLRRVRQGRTAAQGRLDLLYKQDPSRKDESKDDEIDRFRELSRIATSLARKQQVQGDSAASTEKRTSVSLRRGSSVGKRMNAALSHLSGSQSASYSEGAGHVQATSVRASAGVQTAATTDSTDAMPPPTVPNAASTTTPRAQSLGRPPKSDIPQRSYLLSQQDTSSGSHHGARLTGQKSSTVVSGTAVSRASFSSLPKGSGRDGKQGSIAAQQALPNGLPGRATKQPSSKNSVVCPETKALRERKMKLEESLSHLFRKRISKDSLGLESAAMSPSSTLPSPSGVSMASTGTSLQRGSHREVPPNQLRKVIRGPQPAIPSYSSATVLRRKTHWDYLLEEMRWMATDFVEERKWKRCASQNISSAVVRNVHRSASLPTKPTSVVVADASERTRKTGDTLGSVGGSSRETTRLASTKSTILYTEPCLEDITKAKEIASMVSFMIIGLSACPLSMRVEQVTSCNSLGTAIGRASDELQNTQDPNDPNPMDESPKRSSSVSGDECTTLAPSFREQDASLRETQLQILSDYVESIVSKVDPSKKPKHTASATDAPFTASPGQLAAVACIEDLWLRVSAGAILGGPANSGKTVISCSFLWKFRSEGPQLVICSPLSMVCFVCYPEFELLSIERV
jgi:HSA